MKITLPSILVFLMISLGTSCQKKTEQHNIVAEKPIVTQAQKTIVISELTVSDDEFGIGCTTEYYKKGSPNFTLIFKQGGAKDDKSWVNYMNINGNNELFISQNEDTESNDDGTAFTMNLENDKYHVLIKAKLGNVDINSDSTEATGTIEVTDKSSQQKITVDFEGGTAC